MKTSIAATLAVVLAVGSAYAQPAQKIGPDGKPMAPQPPPPLTTAEGGAVQPPVVPTANNPVYVYQQQPIAGQPSLVSPEQARGIIEAFKKGYAKLGEPRILIYVNRELVDEKSGFALSGRTEKTTTSKTTYNSDFVADPNANNKANGGNISAGGNVNISGDAGSGNVPIGKGNISSVNEKSSRDDTFKNTARADQTLADKQTVRDVERLFGRPLRHGNAKITDQRTATQLMGSRSVEEILKSTDTEQARKDRAAIAAQADVVLEVLISSRNITVPEVSGDKTYSAPDIQATAIRVKDSQIIGQASASDILGKDRYAGRVLRSFDVREIAEATALALMEDMLLSVKD
ncbi:MAG TPA: hypothetical protein VGH19_20895 [Verrucomicrobiae bacterium]